MNERKPMPMDPAALVEEARWLGRLARRLARDSADADDIAQDTWAASLTHPAPAAGLRTWLAHVLRNFARQNARGELARRDREARSAKAEALPSAAELSARLEVQRKVVEALASLDEPYRSTVLLRFYEDLSSAEIARRTAVPDGTVRWRLKRGLELLRDKLDRQHADRATWQSAFLIAWRGWTPAAPISVIGGTLLMTWPVRIAVVVVLIAGAWFAVRRVSVAPREVARDDVATATPSVVDPMRPAKLPVPEPLQSERREALGTASETTARALDPGITVRVVDLDGRAIAGATVEVLDVERPEQVTSDGQGAAAISIERIDAESAHVRLRVSATGFFHFDERFRPSGDLTIELPRTTTLRGTVREHGTLRPLPFARVSLACGHSDRCTPDVATADAAGRYALDGVPTRVDATLVVEAEGFPSDAARRKFEERASVEQDFELERGLAVRLRVVDSTTLAPIAGARIVDGHGAAHPFTDANGEWSATLRPDKRSDEIALIVEAEGYCRAQCTLERREVELDPSFDLPLARHACLVGTVRDELGEPVVDAEIEVRADAMRTTYLRKQHPPEQFPSLRCPTRFDYLPIGGQSAAKSDAEGRYRACAFLPRTVVDVVARAAGRYASLEDVVLLPPGDSTRNIRLAELRGAKIRGTATLNGEPARGWVAWRGATRRDSVAIQSDGTYVALDVEVGSVGLWIGIEQPPLPDAITSRHAVTLELEPDRVLVHDFAVEAKLTKLAGRVVRPDGSPVPKAVVIAHSPDVTDASRTSTQDDGTWSFEVPDVGSAWRVVGAKARVSTVREGVRGGTTDLELVLAHERTLRYRAVDATSKAPILTAKLLWRTNEQPTLLGRLDRGAPDADGWRTLELPAGRMDFVLRADAAGYLPATRLGFELGEGDRPEHLALELERGARVTVRLDDDLAPPEGCELFLLEPALFDRLRDEPNAGIADFDDLGTTPNDRLLFANDARSTLLPAMPPGHLHFRAFPDEIDFEPESIDVERGGETTVVVRWRHR